MEGNQMEMREALEQALYFLRRHHMGAVYAPDGETLIYCEDVADIVAKALAKPPRNCDVGTDEEQSARWWKFCDRHFIYSPVVKDNCARCPARGGNRHCELAWAQMPYGQEGGAK